MLSEILSNINNIYETYRGDGKILVIFLISVLALYLIRGEFDFSIFCLIPSPLMAVGASVAKAVEKSKNWYYRLLVIFLCGFAIMLTGERIYSSERISLKENQYYIPEDLRQTMDYILSIDEAPSVIAMPDYCLYFPIYSSKFNMLYEQRIGDDIRYLSEEVRTIFGQLSDQNPDMYIVSQTAKKSGYKYIVLKREHYWPEFGLDRFDYELANSIGEWDIYILKEALNE